MENNIFAIGMSGPIGDAIDVDSAEAHAAYAKALSEEILLARLAILENVQKLI